MRKLIIQNVQIIKVIVELIDPILNKLNKLNEIISKKMNRYRFYDSSILISYDGYKRPSSSSNNKHDIKINGFNNNNHHEEEKLVKVNIMDFTHVQLDKKAPDTPDEGYLLGLKNVIEKILLIKNEISNAWYTHYYLY